MAAVPRVVISKVMQGHIRNCALILYLTQNVYIYLNFSIIYMIIDLIDLFILFFYKFCFIFEKMDLSAQIVRLFLCA